MFSKTSFIFILMNITISMLCADQISKVPHLHYGGTHNHAQLNTYKDQGIFCGFLQK
jgi:hypothetical protein